MYYGTAMRCHDIQEHEGVVVLGFSLGAAARISHTAGISCLVMTLDDDDDDGDVGLIWGQMAENHGSSAVDANCQPTRAIC